MRRGHQRLSSSFAGRTFSSTRGLSTDLPFSASQQSPIIVRTESHRVSDKGSVKLSMPSNQTDVVLNNLGTTSESASSSVVCSIGWLLC